MPENIVHLPVETVENFIRDAFIKLGVPADDAKLCSEVLIASDLRGIQSHGIGRLRYYYDRIISGRHKAVTNIQVIRESPTTVVLDGQHGMGMIVARRAMQLAIEKARDYGMGSAAVRNSTHFGIAGYYPMMAVKEGMVGMAVTNASPSMAPIFGVQPMMGTNPIAFGAPTDEAFPFLFDAATPIIQVGKIEVYEREEKKMPVGWVVDENNQPMLDPSEAMNARVRGKACLLPLGGEGELLGGHKGYGLGTMVEVLSASLQSGSFLTHTLGKNPDGTDRPNCIGHFFMAMNIEAFTDLEDFKKTTGDLLRELRASRKAPGKTRIYTAGEKEYENEKRVRAEGVPIVPNLQKDLLFIKKELGLSEYIFSFE